MEKLLSFEEAEDFTGIKVVTWRKWAAQRRIRVVRLGRRIKIRLTDLEKLIEANTIPAAPDRDVR